MEALVSPDVLRRPQEIKRISLKQFLSALFFLEVALRAEIDEAVSILASEVSIQRTSLGRQEGSGKKNLEFKDVRLYYEILIFWGNDFMNQFTNPTCVFVFELARSLETIGTLSFTEKP
ncbi:hypothetical protein JWG45_01400 [Leptospira sp. 201903070]|uniref:Uncharacterized protein n=1 Tax=Leptospira ainlahdjerensis TaxID=2810033 RepID=A0ABS2U8C5_9LEPT|nr:hypothetical protein [Leptospira ainlahdjerensis]MBM9575798.1 hypothetical protein [Leptospira ainlahdjerensis]